MKRDCLERCFTLRNVIVVCLVLLGINLLLQRHDVKVSQVSFDSNCNVSFIARNITNNAITAEFMIMLNNEYYIGYGVRAVEVVGLKTVCRHFLPKASKTINEHVFCSGVPDYVDVLVKSVRYDKGF